ncbi:MAG: uracil-DNA glycosylase [Finegoldia sp.]|nr:uracil-DNA glycosylase [Finegoldia sp.]
MTVNIGNSWDELLKDEWEKDYYQNIRKVLINDYFSKTVYPDMNDIFNALKLVPYEACKVVILGQDPYHGRGQAHGLSFSVKPGVKIPPSLVNIYKELNMELGLKIPNNGYLVKWAKQGVLLLNSSLTVIENSPNSHQNIGWQTLTDHIIELLSTSGRPIVFMLWGNNARSKKDLIKGENCLVLESAHPSPFSANRGFFGNNHFIKANEFLKEHGLEEIDWQIEDI